MKERSRSNVIFVSTVILKKGSLLYLLWIHEVSVHDRKKPFSCDSCGAAFAVNSKLTRHICTVHETISGDSEEQLIKGKLHKKKGYSNVKLVKQDFLWLQLLVQ